MSLRARRTRRAQEQPAPPHAPFDPALNLRAPARFAGWTHAQARALGGFARARAARVTTLAVAAGLGVGLSVALAACGSAAGRKLAGPELPATLAPLDPERQAHVDRVVAAAAANPSDYETLKEAGLVLMDYTLAGSLDLQVQAEDHLERAFAQMPAGGDRELLRTLGRFYNLRAVEHDFRKADMQAKVYGALLGAQDPATMSSADFVSHSFFRLAQIIQAAEDKRLLRAIRTLRELERELEARTQAEPDDIELRALAGNFALFFAGYVPTGKDRRIRTGIEHFEVVLARWDELRPGARDGSRCPNTYENFAFELAEAHLALGGTERARTIYADLAQASEPVTRGKELVAAVSQHRLDHLERYTGARELMPPWPSDAGNCVVCHSWTGDLPDRTLYVAKGLRVDLSAVPTAARPRPTPPAAVPAEPPPASAGDAASDDPIAAARATLRDACGPCHLDGGRAVEVVALLDTDQLRADRKFVEAAVRDGSMPPNRTLSESQRQAVLAAVATILAGDAGSAGGGSPAPAHVEVVPPRADKFADDSAAARRALAAGLAAAHAWLAGDDAALLPAEAALQQAVTLDAGQVGDRAARALGRLLNVHTTAGQLDRADDQVRLYRRLAASAQAHDPAGMDAFVQAGFLRASEAFAAAHDGRKLAAMRMLRELERDLDARVETHPHDVDVHAMAGNYALAFSTAIPLGRGRRLDGAIEHLEALQSRWDELTPAARGEEVDAPGVRAVFAVWLGQALERRDEPGDRARAARAYGQAIAASTVGGGQAPAAAPLTPALGEVVAFATSRLDGLHAGQRGPLPPAPFPAQDASCRTCHAP